MDTPAELGEQLARVERKLDRLLAFVDRVEKLAAGAAAAGGPGGKLAGVLLRSAGFKP